MPAAVFPRTLKPSKVTPMSVPTGLVSVGHTGKAQLRSVVSMGRTWTETWAALRAGDLAAETLLAWIEWAYNNSKVFSIEHLTTRGSGLVPLSSGVIGVLVNGAGQAGESLNTDGWPINTPDIVRAGDVIRVSGVSPLLRITEDNGSDGAGAVTLKISPSIPAGSSPADDAPVSTNDNSLVAYIASPPNLPPATAGRFFAGMTLHFREAL